MNFYLGKRKRETDKEKGRDGGTDKEKERDGETDKEKERETERPIKRR